MKNLIAACAALALCGTITGQTLTTYTEDDGLLDNTALCVAVDSNDEVWFGTQNGIAHFDNVNWSSFTDEDGLVNNTVWAIAADDQGNIWAGTDFGISKFDGSNWTTYTTDDGLEDNRIKHIFQDADGLMWFGNNDGVSSFDGASFTNYTTDDGLPFGGVAHVNQDQQGNMWFGTGLGGVYVFDGTDFTQYTLADSLLAANVRSIALSSDNKKWVGTSKGITVYGNDNAFLQNHPSLITLPEPHEINPVEDVKIDSQDRVWTGVYVDYLVSVGGVAYYQGGEWTDLSVDDGLAGPDVNQLAITSEDNVWVATGSGVTLISDTPQSVHIWGENQQNMVIYPNPAQRQVTISGLSGSVLEVWTAQGQMVNQLALNHRTAVQLDLTSLPSGLYFLKCNDEVQRLMVVD
ncbi:MAG: T9SS type A sorting domain-containing protein [Flavobacteriales bacterium]|nr:T9SS type A sorting domain-containing protein [Flavobacteriales bacterium]